MAHEPKDLKTVLERCLETYGADLEFKAMFGGIMAYAFGRPFCSLSNVGLAIKLSSADIREILANEGAAPLRYEPDSPPSRQYALVPELWLDNTDQLLPWLEKSIAYVATLPLTPKKKRKSTA